MRRARKLFIVNIEIKFYRALFFLIDYTPFFFLLFELKKKRRNKLRVPLYPLENEEFGSQRWRHASFLPSNKMKVEKLKRFHINDPRWKNNTTRIINIVLEQLVGIIILFFFFYTAEIVHFNPINYAKAN